MKLHYHTTGWTRVWCPEVPGLAGRGQSVLKATQNYLVELANHLSLTAAIDEDKARKLVVRLFGLDQDRVVKAEKR